MVWARARESEGVFVKESHPGPQLRTPWAVAHPQVWVGQGVKLGQQAGSITSASCGAVCSGAESTQGCLQASCLESQRKGGKYLCSPLAFTLLQLLKSEELALDVIFSSGNS